MTNSPSNNLPKDNPNNPKGTEATSIHPICPHCGRRHDNDPDGGYFDTDNPGYTPPKN
ncbi:hypothetical protein FWH09_01625 [Candidatus Saccharibacteria bacterium]|nr:hypothetical protein [Candidatus Saccharibacteria bacterium]